MKIAGNGTMTLLPPAKHLCQVCACDHDPAHPHNAQSLYYGMKFKMDTGLEPSWLTAMAHCTDDVKALWTDGLKRLGVDVEGRKINPSKP